jgi:gamma-glutamylputrescine oxidase
LRVPSPRWGEGQGEGAAELSGEDDPPSNSPSLTRREALSPPGRGDDRYASIEIAADIVILAGNGYLEGVDADVEARVMPIDNYILATAPIGAGRPGGPIAGGEAVSDTRFVVYYFRPSADGRLVFGGGETYSLKPPADIAGFVRRHLARIYPELADTRIDYAWGGTLAITRHRLPFIRRVRPGVYAAAGYSGQGVALAPYIGKLMAEAALGRPERIDAFASIPIPPLPGAGWIRRLVIAAALWRGRMADRF